jgi:hypothetical protein
MLETPDLAAYPWICAGDASSGSVPPGSVLETAGRLSVPPCSTLETPDLEAYLPAPRWRGLIARAYPPGMAPEKPGMTLEIPGRMLETADRLSVPPCSTLETPDLAAYLPVPRWRRLIARAYPSGMAPETPGRTLETPGRMLETAGRLSVPPCSTLEMPVLRWKCRVGWAYPPGSTLETPGRLNVPPGYALEHDGKTPQTASAAGPRSVRCRRQGTIGRDGVLPRFPTLPYCP